MDNLWLTMALGAAGASNAAGVSYGSRGKESGPIDWKFDIFNVGCLRHSIK